MPPHVPHDQGVERQLYQPVQTDPFCRLLLADETWSQCVEEDLERTVGQKFASELAASSYVQK